MLIVSASMQKSGSGYLYNLLNDMQIAAGNADARTIKKKYSLGELMQYHNNNIGKMYLRTLFKLWLLSCREETFVVKTHAVSSRASQWFDILGLVKMIYIYRDPRDVILSVMDEGKRILERGEQHSFAEYAQFDDALQAVKDWSGVWQTYNEIPSILMLKYEELLADPESVMKKCENFVGVTLKESTRNGILFRYNKKNPKGDLQGLHLNKAVATRYKTEMSGAEKERCLDVLGGYIEKMGYYLT